jgi:hypothetical protein
MDTLAVQLTLPLAGCVEDFHLQVSAPCRAHKAKRPGRIARASLLFSNLRFRSAGYASRLFTFSSITLCGT